MEMLSGLSLRSHKLVNERTWFGGPVPEADFLANLPFSLNLKFSFCETNGLD